MSYGCAVNSLRLHHRRVVTSLEGRKLVNHGTRLPLPAIPRHVTIVSNDSTTNCNSFISRLQGGVCNCTCQVRLFRAIVRNRGARGSIYGTLGTVCGHTSRFSIVIVVENKNTSDSLRIFSGRQVTHAYTISPLPIVDKVNRAHSISVLSLITRATIGAPATTTRFVLRLATSTSRCYRTLTLQLGGQMATILVRTRISLEGLHDTLLNGARGSLCQRGSHVSMLYNELRPSTHLELSRRQRHGDVLGAGLSVLSPQQVLRVKCDCAAYGNGTISDITRLARNSAVAARLTSNAIRDGMGSGGWGVGGGVRV